VSNASYIRAYIGIGSNKGDRTKNCLSAIEQLKKVDGIKVTKISSFYHTEPVGDVFTGWFVNCAAELDTTLPPEEIFSMLEEIEKHMGRYAKKMNKDRTIDLDLLFYGNRIINAGEFVVPHPELHKRRFVLVPMAEIAPDFVHPVIKEDVSALLKKLTDNYSIRKLA